MSKGNGKDKIKETVDSIRTNADFIKEHKETYANFAFEKVCGIKGDLKDMHNIFKMYVAVADAGFAISEELEKDPALKAKTVTLLENVVTDISSRMKDFSNVLEAGGNNPRLREAITGVDRAFQEITKGFERKSEERKQRVKKAFEDDEDVSPIH